MTRCLSGLKGCSAKALFVGSNPTLVSKIEWPSKKTIKSDDIEKETYKETVIPQLNVCGVRKTSLCKH